MVDPDHDDAWRGRLRPRTSVQPRTIPGAMALAAALLLAVGGILAIFAGADALGDEEGRGDGDAVADGGEAMTGVVVLLLGLLLFGCAWMAWAGMAPTGGVLAIVTGVILVVLFPDTAGVLAILGGALLLATLVAPVRRLT